MYRIALIIAGVFLSSSLFAQFGKDSTLDAKKNLFEQAFEDEMEIQESGQMTIRFFNAENGNPIENGSVVIKDIGEFVTDEEGKVRFPKVEKDQKLHVLFKKEDYISSVFPVEVVAGTIFFNRFSVSPVLDIGTIRVVLDWDEQPADLDAHFLKQNNYHISYRNTRVLSDGSGLLDRDDMDGFGPETITVSDISENDVYEYFVHDYTNRANSSSANLSFSKATVKVYADNRLMKIFQIPQHKTGNFWKVFTIENGQFKFINEVR